MNEVSLLLMWSVLPKTMCLLDELVKYLSSGWLISVRRRDVGTAASKSGNQNSVFFQPTEKNKPLSAVLGGMPETFEQKINGREYEWTKEWAADHFSEVFIHPDAFLRGQGGCLQQWIKEFSLKVANAPITRSSDTCQVSRLIGPATILVGDAGHSAGARGGMGSVSLGIPFLLRRMRAGQIWQSWIRRFSMKR